MRSSNCRPWRGIFLVAVGLCLAGSALAQSEAEQARSILEARRSAVVTVRLTVESSMSMMGMPGEKEESPVETTGTVIDPSGLTVIALSQTDPMGMLSGLMGGMMGGVDMQMSSEVKDAQILLEGGREIPATVVLRDRDLDLAFLRPVEQQAAPMDHISLEGAGDAAVFDKLVLLNRLGKVVNRTCGGSMDAVRAKVEKPRLYYVPGPESLTAPGGPVFTLDGTFLGVVVMRSIELDGGSMNIASIFSGVQSNLTPIVVPAADIAIGAGQVPAYGEAPAAPEEAPADAPVQEGASAE